MYHKIISNNIYRRGNYIYLYYDTDFPQPFSIEIPSYHNVNDYYDKALLLMHICKTYKLKIPFNLSVLFRKDKMDGIFMSKILSCTSIPYIPYSYRDIHPCVSRKYNLLKKLHNIK